jgi:hypothetical protein
MSVRHLSRRLRKAEAKNNQEYERQINPMVLIEYARRILEKADHWEKVSGMDCLTAAAQGILPDNMTEEEFQIAVNSKRLVMEEKAEREAEHRIGHSEVIDCPSQANASQMT